VPGPVLGFDLHKSGSFIGMAGMAVVLFMNFAAGSVVPWWGVALLVTIWLALFVQACRWFVDHPVRVFWLPFVDAAVWFAFLLGGEALWGWG
jgi:hypothetical protein